MGSSLLSSFRILLPLFAALLCTGCAQGITQLYEGERQPLAKVCLLHNSPTAALLRFDGRNVRPSLRAVPSGDLSYEFEPGRHRLEVAQVVRGVMGEKLGPGRTAFEHDFIAGRTYGFVVAEFRSVTNAKWSVTLINYRTGRSVAEPEETPPRPNPLPDRPPRTTASAPVAEQSISEGG